MKLKACPFCGSDNVALCRNYNCQTKKYFTWAECDVCGAKSRTRASYDDPAENNEWNNAVCQKVAVSWNMRAGEEKNG